MSNAPEAAVVGGPIGILSPHFDDAVMSCGQLLSANPGALIVTAFSAGPRPVIPVPDWDRGCGFVDGDDVMARRREEDDSAAAELRATTAQLGLWDLQYRFGPYGFSGDDRGDLAEGISAFESIVRREHHRVWFVPVGLRHTDHILTSEIALMTAQQVGGQWALYSELPYRLELYARLEGLSLSWTAQREQEVLTQWSSIRPEVAQVLAPSGLEQNKSRAIDHYKSQLRLLNGELVDQSRTAAERCWRLSADLAEKAG
jgi:LmbE family N-acetylglucosaminyl deacetylase